jgi:hypothetical protein
MRFPQAHKRQAVNPAGKRAQTIGADEYRLWITPSESRGSSDSEDGTPAVIGTPMFVPARGRSRILGSPGIGQSRGYRGNTDVPILTIEIGPLVARIGGLCPVCLCFFVAHFSAPSVRFRTLPLEGGGNGRQMAPLDDISECPEHPDFFNDFKQ